VNQIGDLLRARGHRVAKVPVHHGLKWVERVRRADLVFNLCEGIGAVSRYEVPVAGALELTGVPFTGASAWTITICHDKPVVNALLQSAGVPIPRWCVPPADRLPADFPLPAIVKPAAEDASVGIDQGSVVTSRRALRDRVAKLGTQYERLMVQQYVAGREIAVGIVGDHVLPMSEIDFSQMPPGHWPILSFDAKWNTGCVEDVGSRPICPAKLHPALARRIRAAAVAAWRAVRGYGYGRVDLRVDAKGQPWVLEVNPNPDISDDAGLSRMAQATGWSYDDLVLRIVELARQADRRPVPAEQVEGALEARTA
jgi:D-alanine-D-alanine ligase